MDLTQKPEYAARATWNVRQPVLAKTSDRSAVAKVRRDAGPSESWLDDSTLASLGFYGVSFDFFINWTTLEVDPLILAKLEAYRAETGVSGFGLRSVRSVLSHHSGRGANLSRFAAAHGFRPYWALIPNWGQWGTAEGRILLCAVSPDGLAADVNVLEYEEVRDLIAEATGQRFVPQKGLYYSTSGIEGALSATDTPWPGDADLVIADNVTDRVAAVVEFRKQTQDRPLESSFSTYYPKKDKRRWDRLAHLARSLGNPSPPLLGVHYSTLENECGVIVAAITGEPGYLREAETFELQVPTEQKERVAFAEDLIEGARRVAATNT